MDTWILVLIIHGFVITVPDYHSQRACEAAATAMKEWANSVCIPGPIKNVP